MSPPIYTPDGSEVSEIVLPDGSTASQVIGPDGNVVFEAVPDIPDTLIDHFESSLYEDQNVSLSDRYGGDTGSFDRQQTTVYEGNYSLKAPDNNKSSPAPVIADDGVTVAQGDTFEFYIRYGSSGEDGGLLFGASGETSIDGYTVGLASGQIRITKIVDGGFDTILSNGGSWTDSNHSNEWLRTEVNWQTDNTISATIYDSQDNVLGSVSTTDSSYTSGGIGMRSYNKTLYWDLIQFL